MEGPFALESIEMINKHLSSWLSVFRARLGASTTSFFGPKYRKIGLEKHPFCIPFQIATSRAVFYWHSLHWASLW